MKATKLRSKTVYKNLNPKYNEDFHYDGVTPQDLDVKTLRLTVLDEDRIGYDFIGEYRLPLKTLLRNEVNHFNVPLEEKRDVSEKHAALLFAFIRNREFENLSRLINNGRRRELFKSIVQF